MKMKNVLIFPGGTEIGLEINKSLRYNKDIKIFSANSNVSNPAPFHYQRHFIIPEIYSENWINELNKIIAENKIDLIFPAYDDIIVELMRNSKNINAKTISSPLETCLITRSKLKTYEIFNILIPTPHLYKELSEINKFPIFLKPEKGQGSKDTYLVENEKEFKIIMNKVKNLIILEYLPGREYTIDCFTDRRKGLLFCAGRERVRTRSGISVNSKIIINDKFHEIALIISKELEFYGAWFFQLKEDIDGVLNLMEIAPRIAGTMALNRVRGINFPLLSIYEAEGIDINILSNPSPIEIDRTLQNQYTISLHYDTVYIDLDDTLILNNQVNLLMIRFLYQCINQNKKIILITKHKDDIYKTLKKYKINKLLFNEIIKLNDFDNKADYIKERNSIFIDDSFQERLDIQNKYQIPTFDLSMIECLLDNKY